MSKNLSVLLSSAKSEVVKKAPEILTGVSVVGILGSPVLASLATWKAFKKVEKLKKERNIDELSPKDFIKEVWTFYISPLILTTAAVTGVLCANHIRVHREATALAAYGLAETALADFKENADKIVGAKKTTEIKEAVAAEQIQRVPLIDDDQIQFTGRGDTLCFDIISGRYFKSDIEFIRHTINELNRIMVEGDDYVSLNDYYYLIGLPGINIGDDLGWNLHRDKFIKLELSSQLDSKNRPCLVIGFETLPSYAYDVYGD